MCLRPEETDIFMSRYLFDIILNQLHITYDRSNIVPHVRWGYADVRKLRFINDERRRMVTFGIVVNSSDFENY